ncbi:hypothetical protein [uncultured Winogradskyella sp.]|uniref:hypothetical protein n=1 Tax=uncultured Winogradskyella sp. TaxID=395353 RepID=UPI0026114BBC|nr:hypothetical protein [uncultured Winogradskyella sp.]
MAPIKFEEQLKDKLEKRSISPSADSWAKLSERLEADEKKSKNPWFWWMGIAAGLIIMFAIAVQTFGTKATNNTVPQLVEEETIETKIEDLQPNINEIIVNDFVIEDEQIETKKEIEEVTEKAQIINYKSVINKKQQPKAKLAGNSTIEKAKTETINKEQDNSKEATINTTIVVDALKEFKEENKSVTDREVDSLLKLASKELFKDKLQKETSKTVDANSLLQNVEDEMGQSFRSKVFEALKDSYETVKTTVAERNN